PLHPIVAYGVLFDRTSAEPYVGERPGAAIERSGRLQVKLGELPAVDRQALDLSFVHVGAKTCGAGVYQSLIRGNHRYAFGGPGRVEGEVEADGFPCQQPYTLGFR